MVIIDNSSCCRASDDVIISAKITICKTIITGAFTFITETSIVLDSTSISILIYTSATINAVTDTDATSVTDSLLTLMIKFNLYNYKFTINSNCHHVLITTISRIAKRIKNCVES